MRAGIIKIGAAGWIGMSFAGAVYLQSLRAQPEPAVPDQPKTDFEWSPEPASLPEGAGILRVRAASEPSGTSLVLRPGKGPVLDTENGPEDREGNISPVLGFDLPEEAPEAPAERPAPTVLHALLVPGRRDEAWAWRAGGPAELFHAALSARPLESAPLTVPLIPDEPRALATDGEQQAGGGGTGKGPDEPLDAGLTVAPEPATLGLLASGLIALSVAGLMRRRFRG